MAATAEGNTKTGTRKVIDVSWPYWFRRSKNWNWQVIFQGIAAFAIPLSALGLIFSVYSFKAQQQAAVSQVLDQRRQAILDSYLNDISALMLVDHLASSAPGAGVRVLAVARTDTAVQNLDGARKGILIRYLWEAGLIRGESPVVYLHKANLNGAVLKNAYLYNADLQTDYLTGANFYGADPHGANLSWADLSKADLVRANLGCVATHQFDVSITILAQQHPSSLDCANLGHTILTGADMRGANLVGANLSTAYLADANLNGARYNARPISVPRAGRKPLLIPRTQWPAHFPLAAKGARCVGVGCPAAA